MLGITDDEMHKPTRKRKKKGITFNDDEEVINPEDVDPSVGRFRNLIQTTVVPSKVWCSHTIIIRKRNKVSCNCNGFIILMRNACFFLSQRMRMEGGLISLLEDHNPLKHMQPTSTAPQLYHDLPPEQFTPSSMSINPFSTALTSLTSRLGIALPNPAPEVEMTPNQVQTEVPHVQEHLPSTTEPRTMEPKKKKYAKEAWPGKKPIPTLLV